jgi:putative acetyltransferase
MVAGVVIRDQSEVDFAAVHALVAAAFETTPYASGREPFIMDALWTSGAAFVALVADDGAIIGQAAFSKVTIDGQDEGWHALGPVSVLPLRQGQGIGQALIRAGLDRLRALGSRGCVVVGDLNYYSRFGFANTSEMFAPGIGPEHFMALSFGAAMPQGPVAFDLAFTAGVRL